MQQITNATLAPVGGLSNGRDAQLKKQLQLEKGKTEARERSSLALMQDKIFEMEAKQAAFQQKMEGWMAILLEDKQK